MNGRKSGGFSLRKSLEDQGVTTEEGMRLHLGFVADTLIQAPGVMDVTRYRVDPDNPNTLAMG